MAMDIWNRNANAKNVITGALLIKEDKDLFIAAYFTKFSL